MTNEQETLLMLQGVVAGLSPAENEACKELQEHFRRAIAQAGPIVGRLALAVVGAELAAE